MSRKIWCLTVAFLFSWELHASDVIQLQKVENKLSFLEYALAPFHKYCSNPPDAEITDLRKDVSTGRGNQTPGQPSPFFQSDILVIPIRANSKTCDQNCRSAIAHAALISLSLWRSGCSRCRSENLKVIAINGSYWVDNISLDKWRFALHNGIREPNHDPYAISRKAFRPLGTQPSANFINVDNSSVIQSICIGRDKINVEPEIEKTLCDLSPTADKCGTGACMVLPINVGKPHAQCKLNRNTIACGSPDYSVSLNTNDFSFKYDYAGQSDHKIHFGNRNGPKVPLLYTVLHEIGHWFGLPHDEYTNNNWPSNIMSNGYSKHRGWCISEWNLIQMDNAIDLGWKLREKNNTGLRYLD